MQRKLPLPSDIQQEAIRDELRQIAAGYAQALATNIIQKQKRLR